MKKKRRSLAETITEVQCLLKQAKEARSWRAAETLHKVLLILVCDKPFLIRVGKARRG